MTHATALSEAFAEIERKFGARPAFRFLEDMDDAEPVIQWTYTEFVEQLRRGSVCLQELGVEDTDAVGLIVPNTPHGQVALFASELAGRALPMNPLLTEEHLLALLTEANAKVLIAFDVDDRIKRIADSAPNLKHVLSLNGGASSFAARCSSVERSSRFAPSLDPNKIAANFHTGGTTGTPKLAQQSQANQLAAAYASGQQTGLTPDDLIVNALPLFHVAGPICIGLAAITAGACQVLCTRLGARNPKFNEKFWQTSATHGVTVIGAVPTTVGALLASMPDQRSDAIRLVVTGGALLPSASEAAVIDKMGAGLSVIYGMTETAGIIAVRPPNEAAPRGSTGPAVPGNEISIVNDPRQRDCCSLPPGETGHVLMRGLTMGPGYTDASRNSDLFTSDGWLITGDLGSLDAHGNLSLKGRAKDLIIRSGHNIDPGLIETAAETFPGIVAAAAVGAPDAYAGELPVLFVQSDGSTDIDIPELIKSIAALVERPAVPKWVESIESLPLTPVGKIYKPALIALTVKRTLDTLFNDNGIDDAAISVVEKNGYVRAEITVSEKSFELAKRLTETLTVDIDLIHQK